MDTTKSIFDAKSKAEPLSNDILDAFTDLVRNRYCSTIKDAFNQTIETVHVSDSTLTKDEHGKDVFCIHVIWRENEHLFGAYLFRYFEEPDEYDSDNGFYQEQYTPIHVAPITTQERQITQTTYYRGQLPVEWVTYHNQQY